MSKEKILLIDDDLDLVESTKVILESQGFSIITANNGKQGVQELINNKPDLVILDIMMDTNLDGYNTLHTIRNDEFGKNIPVIMMTGIAEAMGVNLRDGVEDDNLFQNVVYLDKPVEADDLINSVKDMLK